jgi:hypothetical protein
MPTSCLPVFRQQLQLVQFGFTLTSTSPLTLLMSQHNLFVRWRRVDPPAKSIQFFTLPRVARCVCGTCSISGCCSFPSPLPRHSDYFDLAVANLWIKFSHLHGAAPRVHLQCKITLYLSNWPFSASRRHRFLIRVVAPFAR